MKKMINALIIFFTISLFFIQDVSARKKFSIEEYGKFINRSLKEWNVPGVAVGIINKGYIILARGYGFRDIKKKLPVTRKTLFAIGSSTKAFTAFLLGQLVDSGMLEWDKPVRNYLPDFKLFDSYASDHMRTRDLLIHDSGLPRHDLVWYGADVSREELYKRLRFLKNSREFRTAFQYQNLMYMTAGYLVGRLKGSSWESVIKDSLFNPLGMKSTNLSVLVSQKSDDYAMPYSVKDGKIIEIPFYKRIKSIAPAGAINSNIDDMLSWLNLILDGGKRDGKQFINPETLKELITPQVIAGGTITAIMNQYPEFSHPAYGMGWFINHYRGHNFIHHGGNIDGFSALVSFMPDLESGVIVLTNSSGNFLTYSAALNVYDGLMGNKPIQWNERFLKLFRAKDEEGRKKEKEVDKMQIKGTKPSHKISDYSGRFKNPAYGIISISLGKSGLKYKYHKFQGSLSHYHYDFFKMEDSILAGIKVNFLLNDKGDIDRVLIPLEPAVDDIVFKRVVSEKLKDLKYLKKFVGNFLFARGNLKAKIFIKGEEKLFLQAFGQPAFQLVPYKENIFSLKDLKGFSFEFKPDAKGNIVSFVSHQPNGDFEAKKIK